MYIFAVKYQITRVSSFNCDFAVLCKKDKVLWKMLVMLIVSTYNCAIDVLHHVTWYYYQNIAMMNCWVRTKITWQRRWKNFLDYNHQETEYKIIEEDIIWLFKYVVVLCCIYVYLRENVVIQPLKIVVYVLIDINHLEYDCEFCICDILDVVFQNFVVNVLGQVGQFLQGEHPKRDFGCYKVN